MRPVLERSALELPRAIRAGELTAAEVLATHIERHCQTAPWLRAIAADRYDAEEREAAAADRQVAQADRAADLPPPQSRD